MFVGGGGAGLLQHDLILAAGGRPANHTDASTVNPDKVRVLIDTILDNPRVRSLFVSWHYQQMAQIDKRVMPVIDALRARKIDPKRFPVVIRMFGRGEDTARQAAAQLPGIHYLPHGAPLSEGVRLIVELTREAQRRAA
jgi:succinyl-CoA synthetase beta subunit/citryl-CoA synthetase large subunit